MEPKLRNQLVRLSKVIEVVEEARIKRYPTKHQDFKWFEKTVMKKDVRQGGEGDGDLRIDDSFFDPPGKLLCETRPPTIYDIVRYRNFLEKRENDKTDSALLKVIVPKLIAIWKKVHPSLILRTEKAISNHLIQIIDKYNQCKLKRSKNDAMNLIAGAHQVFNCSTCKCALAEVWLACAEKSCRKIPPHTHVRCECENSNETRKTIEVEVKTTPVTAVMTSVIDNTARRQSEIEQVAAIVCAKERLVAKQTTSPVPSNKGIISTVKSVNPPLLSSASSSAVLLSSASSSAVASPSSIVTSSVRGHSTHQSIEKERSQKHRAEKVNSGTKLKFGGLPSELSDNKLSTYRQIIQYSYMLRKLRPFDSFLCHVRDIARKCIYIWQKILPHVRLLPEKQIILKIRKLLQSVKLINGKKASFVNERIKVVRKLEKLFDLSEHNRKISNEEDRVHFCEYRSENGPEEDFQLKKSDKSFVTHHSVVNKSESYSCVDRNKKASIMTVAAENKKKVGEESSVECTLVEHNQANIYRNLRKRAIDSASPNPSTAVQPALCQLSSADVKKLKKKTEDLIMMIHEGFDNQVQSELIIKPEEVPIDCITVIHNDEVDPLAHGSAAITNIDKHTVDDDEVIKAEAPGTFYARDPLDIDNAVVKKGKKCCLECWYNAKKNSLLPCTQCDM